MTEALLRRAGSSSEASVGTMMREVLIALIPGVAVYAAWFHPAILINLLVCSVVALLTEALVLRLRQRSVSALSDCTALVTACLLALCLPPLAPWWLVAIGAVSAMLLGKHLYGGTGQNPFNPAMVGYAVLLVCFPLEMTLWLQPVTQISLQPGLSDTFSIISGNFDASAFDSYTAATPLDRLREARLDADSNALQGSRWHGWVGAYAWEWINLAFACGGLWLLYRGVIRWHIPVALLTALGACYLISWLWPGGSTTTPWFGLLSGATMLGAFFIATDPVSAATSRIGRLVYAAGIGLLVFLIREHGGYPDGMAFAVLLMNCMAPAIDHYCHRFASRRPER